MDWWVDGHFVSAPTADEARAEARRLYGFTPETVRHWTSHDQERMDLADLFARHDEIRRAAIEELAEELGDSEQE